MFNKLVNQVKLLFVDKPIKGNVRADGEKIYHTPDGRLYEATKAEYEFASEKDAIKAGFRKSKM